MHSPSAALANKSRTSLQRIYATHLRHICGVKFATPSAMLLAELGLLLLQVFWWRQTLQFYNKLATSPRDSLFHIILLDNQHDAFQRGVKNFCGSIHRSLGSIGHSMCCDNGVACIHDVPLLTSSSGICRVSILLVFIVLGQPHLRGWLVVLTISGSGLIASTDGIASCLCLVGVCNGFCSLDLPHMVCPSSLAAFQVVSILPGQTGSVSIAVVRP